MKKLLFLIAITVLSFNSFASYRTKVCALRGTTDTTQITLQDRIDYCVKENCAKILNGSLSKTNIINNTQFTDVQLVEFALRGVRGSMTQMMTPNYTADATIAAQGSASTDAQLDTAFLYIVWVYTKLIGIGSL